MQTSQAPVRRDSLGLSAAIDLMEDVDFESTMMVLEHSERDNGGTISGNSTPGATRRRYSSFRRGSIEQLDLSLTSLAELFPTTSGDGDGLNFLTEEQMSSVVSTIQAAASTTMTTADNLRVRLPSSRAPLIKTEFPPSHSPSSSMLSPAMDSFLRDSWGEINDDLTSKTRRTSSKLLEGLMGHSMLSPSGASPRRLSVTIPGSTNNSQHEHQHQRGTTPRMALHNLFAPVLPLALPLPLAGSTGINASQSKRTKTARATNARAVTSNASSSSPKQPRRAKQCVEEGCGRRAQSNNRCKTHGGGARCQMTGCDKSSQGGGLCRAHGGGKKCRVSGCTKGTQRLGLCYLHGGIRRCIQEGCKKKDRGNGYCISHGGGRRCEVTGCTRSVRKGNHCQSHQGPDDAGSESPFNISRGHTLHGSQLP